VRQREREREEMRGEERGSQYRKERNVHVTTLYMISPEAVIRYVMHRAAHCM
jgi:hypothetical protein